MASRGPENRRRVDAWGRDAGSEAAPPGATGAPHLVHGGVLAAEALRSQGVAGIFTLSGGHVFPVYDGCVTAGLRIVDVRHEQSAVFAAEAVAKLTRRPGVAVVTAGPGVTNGVSAMTTAGFNGSPILVLAGRAPAARWGSGSLQELDHVPIVAPVVKQAATVLSTADIFGHVVAALTTAQTPKRGPVFVDVPLDVLFAEAPLAGGVGPPGGPGPPGWSVAGGGRGQPHGPDGPAPDPAVVDEVAEMLAGAKQPVVVAGNDVWWGGAVDELRAFVEAAEVPTFVNGLGRGCVPADHPLSFSRARSLLPESDLVLVAGAPLDFRLSFGRFGSARVVHLVESHEQLAGHVELAAGIVGSIKDVFARFAERAAPVSATVQSERRSWRERLRDHESSARSEEAGGLASAATPIHPMRIYGELRRRLDRDAIVIGDGGDFVSYAGRLIDSYEPGCWLDPGPFGCLGAGLGYAIAARVVHPDRQVVLLAGDGAFGLSAMDVDTLVRHRLPVVIVIGNNGIWGLEKHPMQLLYGYDVAADLQDRCRYDEVVRALGGAGEIVDDPDGIGPALDRAFASGVPYAVNVVYDPAAAYPRRSNLA